MIKKIIYILFLLVISCSNNSNDIDSEEITYEYSPQASLDLFIDGNRYLNQGKYKEAEKTFEKLIIIDPEFSKAWEGLADSSLMQSNLNKSLEYLNNAIAINSSISSHLSKKALVLYYLDDLEASESFANSALENNPIDVRAIIVSASIKADKGLIDQSNELFDLAIKLEPDDSSIYYWKAKSYREYNIDLNQSMQIINKAIEMDRSAPSYFIERALLYYSFGELANAEEDLLEAIEIAKNPRNQNLIDKAKEILEDVKK
ncbi:MAG: tetratricopeptide repeat protein [Dehalococcoidia bacterium]|mgnify:FL=1|jgi:tetratricopeptide (TPR) repeat protein|nr:hypothetical protein [Chloroflexota bacterium]MBP05847.1 hypothetical protein [Chloroflexota bacterium]RZP13722.1 MAG: tetratricopeptide repeat protein [Chloroflexota bacterium]|tara:strand:- start:11211 stop:11990 length:780 start_codon:yes stop_codon:yes gene_type:complete